MPDVTIRPAVLGDVPAIQALSLALFQDPSSSSDQYLDMAWPTDARGRKAFEEAISDAGYILLVAVVFEKIVGYLYGEVLETEEWRPVPSTELGSFYVLPDYQGLGIGKLLTRDFLDWSRGQGAKIAKVTAYADNERGIAFYTAQGFAPESLNMEVEL